MNTCTYCTRPALANVDPPLCERHLDIAIIAEYLADRGQPVTVDTVTAKLRRCYENHGALTAQPEEVETLLRPMGLGQSAAGAQLPAGPKFQGGTL